MLKHRKSLQTLNTATADLRGFVLRGCQSESITAITPRSHTYQGTDLSFKDEENSSKYLRDLGIAHSINSTKSTTNWPKVALAVFYQEIEQVCRHLNKNPVSACAMMAHTVQLPCSYFSEAE